MINLFLDLDGTLAKFNSKRNALKRFDNEIGFFANLKPYKYIEFVNELANNKNVNVYVISATPNDQADQDKLVWIEKYLNNIFNDTWMNDRGLIDNEICKNIEQMLKG